MQTDEKLAKQRELVERVGVFLESLGKSPVSSRILALLLVMDKQHFTFEEIIDELKVSKSAASNGIQNLLQ